MTDGRWQMEKAPTELTTIVGGNIALTALGISLGAFIVPIITSSFYIQWCGRR